MTFLGPHRVATPSQGGVHGPPGPISSQPPIADPWGGSGWLGPQQTTLPTFSWDLGPGSERWRHDWASSGPERQGALTCTLGYLTQEGSAPDSVYCSQATSLKRPQKGPGISCHPLKPALHRVGRPSKASEGPTDLNTLESHQYELVGFEKYLHR